MYVHKGGTLYGFCPAKATWDEATLALYNVLVVAYQTGAMWAEGPLSRQPMWFVELLAWFIPRYDGENFANKVRLVVGDGSKKLGG